MVNDEIRRWKENLSDRRPFMEVMGNPDSTARGKQVTKGDWGPPKVGGDGFRAEDQIAR